MKTLYSVQHGDEDCWDRSFSVYGDAVREADELHVVFPGEEIRIIRIESDDGVDWVCEAETTIYDSDKDK